MRGRCKPASCQGVPFGWRTKIPEVDKPLDVLAP